MNVKMWQYHRLIVTTGRQDDVGRRGGGEWAQKYYNDNLNFN